MKPANPPSTVAEILGRRLATLPGVHRVRSVRGLVASPTKNPRRFLLADGPGRMGVRVADHFDLELDAIVHDPSLGSLGLVWSVPEEDANREWLRECIDGAAYLRHLLIEETRRGRTQAERLPYAVEVVFAVRAANPDTLRVASARLGEVLREITRGESYLDAVGINLWPVPLADGDSGPDDDFRRAFSWLLTATEGWYGREPKAGLWKPVENGVGTLRSLLVEDFRVEGTRELVLDPRAGLHLVFGHNGSGKSSLSEALELVVTGRIQRIEKSRRKPDGSGVDYLRTLTNRSARDRGRSAQVQLVGVESTPRSWTVEPAGVSTPLETQRSAAAFRLDQFAADELAQGDDERRARFFLEAFFHDDTKRLDAQVAKESAVAAIFTKLPEHARSKLGTDPRVFDAKQAADVLAPLGNGSVAWPWVLGWLPVAVDTLSQMGSQWPEAVREVFRRTDSAAVSEIEKLLPELDGALRDLGSQAEVRLQSLERAIELLQEYGDASVAANTPESEPLVPVFNRWLEHVAWADLLERQNRIRSTLESASAAGFVDTHHIVATVGATPPENPEDRKKTLEAVQRDRDEWQQRVRRFQTEEERVAKQARTLRPLSELLPAALDQAAQWGVFGDAYRTATPSLGAAVQQAFRERKPVPVKGREKSGETVLTTVGDPGWGVTLLADAQRARQALQQWSAVQGKLADPTAALAVVWPTLKQLRTEAVGIDVGNRNLLREFLQWIRADRPLGRAINELMALLTPARWAYQDLSPSLDLQGGGLTLEVRTADQEQAKLRLNTAELNTFAVAIFLLCAPGVPNTLRLLVLDDPLQNMDELTVTTVARGLGRLLKLWRSRPGGEAWRLLLLIHDESSLDRFRNETPCASYILPWLSPQETPKDVTAAEPESVARLRRIKPLESLVLPELQSLATLVKARPKPGQVVG